MGIENKIDNRMRWILELDLEKPAYSLIEVQVFQNICGVLDYHGFKARGSIAEELKDKSSLGTIFLPIKSVENNFSKEDYHRDGYYFPGDFHDELISIFSFFFRIRFYKIAVTRSYSQDWTDGLSKQIIGDLFGNEDVRDIGGFQILKRIESGFQDRSLSNNWCHVPKFLDLLQSIPEDYHYRLAHAFRYYADSLRLLCIDEEMAWVRLVSAIEILAQDICIDTRGVDEKLKGCSFDKNESEIISNILRNYGATRKFIDWIIKYSRGFVFTSHQEGTNPNVYIEEKDLEDILKRIYKARSSYLHAGYPMYISYYIESGGKFDISPEGGSFAQSREFDKKQLLPYFYWFEKLAHHCILNYITEISAGK